MHASCCPRRRRFFGWVVCLCALGLCGFLQLMILLYEPEHKGENERHQARSGLFRSLPDYQKNKGYDKNGGLHLKPHHSGKPPNGQDSERYALHDLYPSGNTFVSPFHRHWKTDCADIFSGDKDVIRAVFETLRKERLSGNGSIGVPDDSAVQCWTRDCDRYRRVRHYPTNPATEDEAGFPLAYIIVVHKEAAQVERLLRAIYQPQNLYCLHPDAKSPLAFKEAIQGLARCFPNVFIASKTEDVQYAGFTRLLADINCMRDLVGPRGTIYRWKYVINLCGQDFPMKTNLEIVRQLKAYKGHNDITGIKPPSYITGRTRYHYIVKNRHVTRTKKLKTPPPHNLTINFGNAYYAATRHFVEYVLTNRVGIDLLEWSRDTYSPDEHYWATLQRTHGTPGGFPNPTWDENIRFMKWGDIKKHPPCRGKYVRGLCVFGIAYLEYLAKQPHLFANKFQYSFDPVTLQCIEEALDNRTRNLEESNRLPKFPVLNLIWQNHIALP